MTFKINDRIRMTDTGKRKWTHDPSNPHDIEGFVRQLPTSPSDSWIYVTWDNGRKNAYRLGELELAPMKVGTRVVLTDAGKARYESQARGTTGTLLSNDREWMAVKWDSGYDDVYKPEHIEAAPQEIKQPKEKDMTGKEKTYTDQEGDVFEVDTLNSREFVYFTTGEGEDGIGEGQIVRLRRDDVQKIRKQLKKWLDRTATPV